MLLFLDFIFDRTKDVPTTAVKRALNLINLSLGWYLYYLQHSLLNDDSWLGVVYVIKNYLS